MGGSNKDDAMKAARAQLAKINSSLTTMMGGSNKDDDRFRLIHDDMNRDMRWIDILKDLIRHGLFTDQTDNKVQIFRKYVIAKNDLDGGLRRISAQDEMSYRNIVYALKKSIKGIKKTSLSTELRALYDKIFILTPNNYKKSELINFIERESILRSRLEKLLRQKQQTSDQSISSFLLKQQVKQKQKMIKQTTDTYRTRRHSDDTLFSNDESKSTDINEPGNQDFINNLKKYLIGGFIDFTIVTKPTDGDMKT